MSKTIDQRVVEMRFDNKHFETNVSTTMSTLDKLKQKLNLSGATKGLENVSVSAKKCDMSGIASSVETVSSRFSALGVIGTTALVNITNSAVNAGKRIVSALTIDPVKTGFQEYELKMGSIQTIMASTGESLDVVNRYLQELNEYSDKTIYSFSDMTQNIGKFTNAGVKLEDAVKAIQGISNEAAVSGANANEAARAMYNFAQALSAGYVKLIDWKSIENANMATVEFKNELIKTAIELGTVTKAADGMYHTLEGNAFNATKNFNEVFQDQWMTSEVLIQTLGRYADETTEIGKKAFAAAQDVKTFSQMWDVLKESAQSGWAQTWEIIVGDFEEAKSLFTPVTEFLTGIIGKISDSRNKLLKNILGSPWEKFEEQVSDAGISLDKFRKSLVETAEQHGHSFDDMSTDEEKFDKLLKKGWLTKDLVVETIGKYTKKIDGASESTGNMTEKLEKFQTVVDEVWKGSYKNGAERIEALTKAGYDYAEVQELVNKTVDGHRLTLEDLSEEQLKNIGYTEKEIDALKRLGSQAEEAGTPLSELLEDISKPSGRELLFDTFANIIGEFSKLVDGVKNAWNNVFGDIDVSGSLYNFIERLNDLSEAFTISEEAAANFQKICEGIFSIFQLGTSIVSMSVVGGLKIFSAVLEAFGTDLLTVAGIIAEYITKFANWVKEHTIFINTWDKIGKILAAVIKGIESCVDAFKSLTVVKNLIKDVGDAFAKFFGKIGDGFDGINIDNFCDNIEKAFNAIADWIKSLENSENIGKDFVQGIVNGLEAGIKNVVDTVINIGTKIITTIMDVLDEHSPSVKGFTIGWNFIIGIWEGLKNAADVVWSFIKDFGKQCIDLLKKIDVGAVIAVGMTVGMFVIVKKMLDIMEGLTSPIKSVGNFFDGLADFFGETKADKLKKTSQAVLNFAAAIGILAASMYILSKITWQDLLKATVTLVSLGGAMYLFTKSVSKIGTGDVKVAMVLGMSLSLILVASALSKLASIDISDVPAALITFTAAIGGLTALIYAMGKFINADVSKNITKVGTTIIKISIALLLMTAALKLAAGLEVSEVMRGVVAIGALELIVLSMAAMPKLSNEVGGTILKMSAALLLMIAVIKLASKISLQEVLKGSAAILAAEVLFAGIIKIAQMNQNGGKGMVKMGAMLLLMSTSLLILTSVIKRVAEISVGDLTKGLIAISILEAMFIAVLAVSKLAGEHALKAGAMLLLMSGALFVVSALMYIIANMPTKGLGKALGIIATLEILFMGLIGVTKLASNCKATLIILTVAISLLIAAFVGLTFLDQKEVENVSKALSSLLVAFSILVASSKFLKNSKGLYKALIPMVVVVGLLAGIVAALTVLDINPSVETAKALSILLLSLSAACLILSKVGPSGTMAINGALALAGVVLTLGVLAIALGELNKNIPQEKINEWKSGIDKFMQLLVALAGGLGDVIGAFFGGIVGGFLEKVGESLSTFMTNVQGFLDGVKDVKDDVLKGAANLTAAIVLITAADFINGITTLGPHGSTLGDLGSNLSDFMDKASGFIDGVKSVKPEVAEGAKNLALAMVALTGADFLNGIKEKFGFGDNSLAVFGEELAGFGPHLKAFSDSVVGLDKEAILAASEAAKNLAEMAAVIPNIGGMAAFFAGENDLETFGAQLVSFGSRLKRYSIVVSGMEVEPISASVNAAKSLAEMAAVVPNFGGMVAFFTGDNDLETFGAQLVSFGSRLKRYSIVVSGMEVEPISASVNAAKALGEMASAIPNYGGMAAFFAGDNDIQTFGAQLVMFGTALKDYSIAVTDIQTEPIYTSVYAAKALSKLATDMPKSGGLWSVFTADNDMSTFGREIVSFGKSLSKYSQAVTGVDKSAITNSVDSAVRILGILKNAKGVDLDDTNTFVSAINNLGRAGVKKFVEAFNSSTAELNTVGRDMIDAVCKGITSKQATLTAKCDTVISKAIKEINNKKTSFRTFGVELIKNLIDGIESQKSRVTNSMNSALSSMVNEIREYRSSFYSAGSYLVSGFANGISENTYRATAKAKAMAAAAARAARKELDIHSPSRVTEEIGENFGEGFVKGVANSEPNTYASGVKMAESAMDGLNDGLNEPVDMTAYWDAVMSSRTTSEEDYDLEKFQKDILEETTSIMSGYTDELERNTEALMKRSSIFSAVSEQEEIEDSSLLKNLEDQVVQLERYGKAMESLKEKLGSTSIYSTIAEMGLDSLSELEALNRMTDSELNKYISLYDKKYTLSQQIAESGMTSVKATTEEELSDLFGGATVELNEFIKVFDGTFDSINSYVSKAIAVGGQISSGVAQGVSTNAPQVNAAAVSMIDTSIKEADNLAENESSIIGSDLVSGFANGISSNTYKAVAKAKEMASKAAAAARRELDEHSPSKVFYSIGNFAGLGFVNALSDYADKAYTAGSEMASSAKNGLQTAIANIAEAVNSDIDTQPTIRPVLDLTDIQNGANQLYSMFPRQTLALAGANAGFSAGSYNNFGSLIDHLQRSNESSNAEVVAAIANLRGDFGSLIAAINGMQIRMDGGAVVGELIGKIDNGLGQIAIHKGRGN